MSDIVLLDTSIYLNVLDVPGFNQERANVIAGFEGCIANNDHFLLPLAAVWETGKHISQLADGHHRLAYAEKLTTDVQSAFAGEQPYAPTHFPDREEFRVWLNSFPDAAMRALSLADHSLVQEWERSCNLNPQRRVRIWSLDGQLVAYDRGP